MFRRSIIFLFSLIFSLAVNIPAQATPDSDACKRATRSLAGRAALLALKVGLPLRYRIHVKGLENLPPPTPGQGTLILPNHPGLIDPMILTSTFDSLFHTRPVMHSKVAHYPFGKQIAQATRAILIPEMSDATKNSSALAEAAMNEAIVALKNGENVMMWPSGQILREAKETLGAKSGVRRILDEVPNLRIVLVRSEGLWGSRFTFAASGHYPDPVRIFSRTLPLYLLGNLVFFGPRRPVEITVAPATDLPRAGTPREINAYLENFFNSKMTPNTHLPLYWWQGRQPQVRPEPESAVHNGHSKAENIPQDKRDGIYRILRERQLIEADQIPKDSDRLSDLGLDSLAHVEFILEIEKTFGVSIPTGEGVVTVADALRAAAGQSVSTKVSLKPVPKKWAQANSRTRPRVLAGATIPEVFLKQFRSNPHRVILADQISGAKTTRELVAAVLLLRPIIQAMPGERIGIMLPASVSATTFMLATQFAGKVPVMLNWTTGERNLRFSMDELGIQQVITAGKLIEKLKSQGMNLDAIQNRFFMAESLAQRISKIDKLTAFAKTFSPVHIRALRRAPIQETSVILMTSGSENTPKAVPLTHEMQIENVKTFDSFVHFKPKDRMLGFLPPFHSMGNTGLVVAPLVMGLPVVYHSNPLDSPTLAAITKAYEPTIVAGAPSFLKSLAEASTPEDLAPLRLAVSGAEALTKPVVDLLNAKNPNFRISEGYGITETGPLIAATPPGKERMGSVGFPVSWVTFILIDPETNEILMKGKGQTDQNGNLIPPRIDMAKGRKGILLVSGASVMSGYLTKESKSPFVQYPGREYYNTGDIIRVDEDGYFWVEGRVKEMVKIGGEMVSLAAIRKILIDQFGAAVEGPSIAVGADERSERAQIVLVTSQANLSESEANKAILNAGLNGLHRISKIIRVPEIPMLGSGKLDSKRIREIIHNTP